VEIALPLKPSLRHPALTLAVLAMAQFIIAVDYNIVHIALPSIGSALHFAPRQLQWVVSAYAITFGGLLLLGGRLSDLVGRRRSFIVALSLYGIGSLAGGIASQPALLITARAVQGLGGALLFPTTLALVSTFYEEGLDRSGALAAVGAAGATGGASGALLGGLLTSAWGWSWTFFINVPIALAVATIAWFLLPHDSTMNAARNAATGLDVPGAISGTLAITCLVLACVNGPQIGFGSAPIVALIAASGVLLAAFLLIEHRSLRPLMPLRLLQHRTLTAGMMIAALFAASFGAQYYLLTRYLQEIRHYLPSAAGFAFHWLSTEVHTGPEVAAIFSDVLGRPIRCIVRQPAELEAIFLSGALKVESWYAKGGVDWCVQIADGRMGYIGTVRDDVPHLLGRPATTLRQWAGIHKDQLLAFTETAAAA
jgi:MFS family permease